MAHLSLGNHTSAIPVHRALRALVVVAVALGFFAGVLTDLWRRYRSRAGDPSPRLDDRWHEGHLVVDRRGEELRDLPSEAGHRGRSTPLEAIGGRMIAATLVSEDKDFFAHEGIQPRAVARAVAQNLRHGRLVSGASTITQQLVKMLDNEGRPRPRTLSEKLREAARAENLERTVGKRAILEAYLNRLSYGHGLTGPEAAARAYFGKPARDLSWAEAAYLAVLPRAPSYLDPYAHPERAALRQRLLLDALRDEGLLPEADHARAVAERVAPRRLRRPFLAPHLVEALREEGLLADGAVTRTTLDLALQRDVEGLVRTHLAALGGLGATSAAVMVVDNASGEVLAYVGSADFDDPSIAGQLDVVRARRQPGSTLKPFVYAMAFERGHTGSDALPDVPTRFSEGTGAYAPGNFDGTFLGPVSAREALAGSLNVPAIRLAAELPKGALLDTLHALGFASLDRDAEHYGLALALGSGEVQLRELAGAYVALARGGERIPLRAVVRDPTDLGRPIPAGGPGTTRVLAPDVAAEVTEILSDPLARVRGLHGRGPFDVGFPVALKTGTSSGFRDTWTAGYTRERAVVVWVGNADGSPAGELTGATGAGPLFSDVMVRAMRDVPARAPLWDEALLETAEVCPLSGKLAGPSCPERVPRRFRHGHVPGDTCDLHAAATERRAAPGEPPFRCDPAGKRVVHDGAASGPMPHAPARVIVLLPEAFDAWLAAQPPGAPGQDAFGLPWFARSQTPGCAPEGVIELAIDSPASGTVFALSQIAPGDDAIELRASATGPGASRLAGVEFVVDGELFARSSLPFRATMPARRGDHEILVRPIDARLSVRPGVSRFSVR